MVAVKRIAAASPAARPGRLPPTITSGGDFAPAPRIDVKFPILGFLMDSEMTGYDLKRRFRDPVGFFYRVSDGSLYPALKKLARDGLVRMRTERTGKRARKVYSITAQGRERFLTMLAEPAAPMFVYDEARVKIYFAHHAPRCALEHLERMRTFDEIVTEHLGALAEAMKREGESPFHRVIVELGRELTALEARLLIKLQDQLTREIARGGRNLRRAAGSGK